jgi:hypothetical protein
MWKTSDVSKGKDKETICHRTSSEKNPWVEITVSVNALQTHLNHGDFIGKCEETFEYNAPPPKANAETVTVCHKTNCDSAPFTELQVPSSTVQAHLNANTQDFIGECLLIPEYVTKSYSYNKDNREKVEEMFKQEEPESFTEGKFKICRFMLYALTQSLIYFMLPHTDFYGWRDKHLLIEIFNWGWHIDCKFLYIYLIDSSKTSL